MNPTWFPTLADPEALIDEFFPAIGSLLARPHLPLSDEWQALRNRLDAVFQDAGWDGDESRVAFDLLVAFAGREQRG
jgi:hypothetical protein